MIDPCLFFTFFFTFLSVIFFVQAAIQHKTKGKNLSET